jgi:hypothetical protein
MGQKVHPENTYDRNKLISGIFRKGETSAKTITSETEVKKIQNYLRRETQGTTPKERQLYVDLLKRVHDLKRINRARLEDDEVQALGATLTGRSRDLKSRMLINSLKRDGIIKSSS